MLEFVENSLEELFGSDPPRRRSIWTPVVKSLILRRILPLDRISGIIRKIMVQPEGKAVSDRILDVMGVSINVSAADQARVPATGPLVAVANHPFGAIEGLVLASVLQRTRHDIRIMANFLLGALGLDELNELLLFVDPLRRKDSALQNVKPLRDALQWVRGGRALGIFPAGEVSHVHFGRIGVTDRQWNSNVARIIRKTEATILPVYFEGRNSFLFCGLGLLHPLIRTAMLPRENLKEKNRTLRVHIGKPVPFKRVFGFSDSEMMDYMRMRTYNLRHRNARKRSIRLSRFKNTETTARNPVESAKAIGSIAGEMRGLPREQVLISTRDFDVVCATADQIPNTMFEIGRLREITFRKAGEGTGSVIDIDSFDAYYQHLVLWNRDREEVAGAYRLGLTDAILGSRGLKGLYTTSLFDYDGKLFRRISPALEVGRSFVRGEYQKTYQPLLLLWTGIGRYVVKEPRYRYLFGSVSISNAYLGISRRLIIRCLKNGYTSPELAKLVRARHPAPDLPFWGKSGGLHYSLVQDINEVSELVADIEEDSKGIPILLKQYTKLGGQFLGFGVDPKFNNAVDALVLVDLTRTDPKILGRYMGQSGLESFYRYHCADKGGEASA